MILYIIFFFLSIAFLQSGKMRYENSATFDRFSALFVRGDNLCIFPPKNYTNRAFPIFCKGFESYKHHCGKVAKSCGKLRKPLILQGKRVEISVESVENSFEKRSHFAQKILSN